jgi:hypothetical protein
MKLKFGIRIVGTFVIVEKLVENCCGADAEALTEPGRMGMTAVGSRYQRLMKVRVTEKNRRRCQIKLPIKTPSAVAHTRASIIKWTWKYFLQSLAQD